MEDRENLLNWIKEHKKELIIAGASIGALALLILGIKHEAEIKVLWNSLRKLTQKSPEVLADQFVQTIAEIPSTSVKENVAAIVLDSNHIPFEVSEHIRNLPNGWHASPEKIAEALEHGITLMDGQTLVDSYMKGGAAA